MSPLSALLWLLAAGAGFAYWNAARAAAERAGEPGRTACKAAGVIWLDQSVHANGLHLRRREAARLGFERRCMCRAKIQARRQAKAASSPSAACAGS